ncbi:MAG: hypothetical protein JXA67_11865 [Micromonosporaceae bacterium]|nr:hypothetical protein [Micromonosporaceae bacterium]
MVGIDQEPDRAWFEGQPLALATISARIGVKAAGGVSSLDTLLTLHQAGATRFGAVPQHLCIGRSARTVPKDSRLAHTRPSTASPSGPNAASTRRDRPVGCSPSSRNTTESMASAHRR